jgi:hypothetical protein
MKHIFLVLCGSLLLSCSSILPSDDKSGVYLGPIYVDRVYPNNPDNNTSYGTWHVVDVYNDAMGNYIIWDGESEYFDEAGELLLIVNDSSFNRIVAFELNGKKIQFDSEYEQTDGSYKERITGMLEKQ